ncbi:7-carboxy-7-deazaguanine synthase [Litorimonas haliclonae]|uniref:7-carboxy-7-deazaguanine synthase n=1 Tax=Litorimonas haliclonae TaxID=2081977 RepID=UPI0039F1023F
MSYAVKECYLTVQGEGAQAGITAVFLRFAGCNLWSGLERDRAKAVCQFCDTDFVGTNGPGGGKFKTANALADHIAEFWPQSERAQAAPKWVVCTGGEPALQLDKEAIEAFHEKGFKIAIETNGTIALPEGLDWICVSPKANADLVQTTGHELKLVYPQKENRPEDFSDLDFGVFSLQPLDDTNQAAHSEAAFEYCLEHPKWRLSVQTHKYLGVP